MKKLLSILLLPPVLALAQELPGEDSVCVKSPTKQLISNYRTSVSPIYSKNIKIFIEITNYRS
jgi:hypothetical protein